MKRKIGAVSTASLLVLAMASIASAKSPFPLSVRFDATTLNPNTATTVNGRATTTTQPNWASLECRTSNDHLVSIGGCGINGGLGSNVANIALALHGVSRPPSCTVTVTIIAHSHVSTFEDSSFSQTFAVIGGNNNSVDCNGRKVGGGGPGGDPRKHHGPIKVPAHK